MTEPAPTAPSSPSPVSARSGAAASAPSGPSSVDATTVEDVVRRHLTKALGGRRGIVEGAVPTIGFTLTYVLSGHQLRLALVVGGSLALVLLAVRLLQRQSVQFVVNSGVGIAIAAVFALRSGKAQDVFLPGIIYNAGYAALMTLSVLVRWPVVGFMIGSVTGDPTGWRQDPAIVRLCSKLTWLLVIPCAVRFAVQWPLYLAGQVGWLGATKLALGWPLQVAALAAMAYLLARGRTPLEQPGPAGPEA